MDPFQPRNQSFDYQYKPNNWYVKYNTRLKQIKSDTSDAATLQYLLYFELIQF